MGDTIIDEVAQTITFTDVSITFPYAYDVQTKVGTIVITGANGLSNIAFNIQGQAGLPPAITAVMHEVEPDDPLPGTNPAVTVLDPGGPGEASQVQLDFYVHKGDEGEAGSFAILSGTDLDTTDAAPGYTVVLNDDEDGFQFAALPFCEVFWPGSISATASSNTTPRLLGSVSIPARPWKRRVIPTGMCVVTGSTDTRVDLIVRLNNADSGDQVGRALGQAGAAPPPLVIPFAIPVGKSSSYGVVAAGDSASVHFRAEQQAASSNNWSTPAGNTDGTGTQLGVLVVPVL